MIFVWVEDTVYEDNLVVINVNKCFILYRRRSHALYGLIGEGSVDTNKELANYLYSAKDSHNT